MKQRVLLLGAVYNIARQYLYCGLWLCNGLTINIRVLLWFLDGGLSTYIYRLGAS